MPNLLPGIVSVIISGGFGALIRYFVDNMFSDRRWIQGWVGAVLASVIFGAVVLRLHDWLADDIRWKVNMWTLFLFWYMAINPEGTKALFVGQYRRLYAVRFVAGTGLTALCMGVSILIIRNM